MCLCVRVLYASLFLLNGENEEKKEKCAVYSMRGILCIRCFIWTLVIVLLYLLNQAPGMTTEYGSAMETKTATMTLGRRGPVLIQDNNFIEDMAHFDRERIPERVVHAKGAGAFGYFECTHNVTKYTTLSPFVEVGKKTPLVARFSTVGNVSVIFSSNIL